ncbi:hypothetical protein LOK49_LG13G00307 [Camellia lanceoleosa]|uniref:Uncharacterized protein n=1 Tax=Camellia lanceoleosa TaxID=1840588 RepID=A0ACC0FJF6_9ERIC|nr:hypothetical protein LOK49_LG13G00307 [Camellia lanceoleosa]
MDFPHYPDNNGSFDDSFGGAVVSDLELEHTRARSRGHDRKWRLASKRWDEPWVVLREADNDDRRRGKKKAKPTENSRIMLMFEIECHPRVVMPQAEKEWCAVSQAPSQMRILLEGPFSDAPTLGGVVVPLVDLVADFRTLSNSITYMRPSGAFKEAPLELPEDRVLTLALDMRQPPATYT